MTERIPPHNIEAEQSVLSGVLLDDSAFDEVADTLHPDDFYITSHGEIWSAMMGMKQKGMPIDLITLTNHLQATGKIEVVGGPAAISNLAGQVSTASNIDHWATAVRAKAIYRKIINDCHAVIQDAYDDPEDADIVIGNLEKIALDISQRNVSERDSIRIDEAVHNAMEGFEKISLDPKKAMGITTGFPTVDEITRGLHGGDLSILAGRTSHGKSTTAMNLSIAAAKGGAKVLFFSLEQKASNIAEIMLCSNSGVRLDDARWGWRDEPYEDRRAITNNMWARAVPEFNNLNVWLNDTTYLTPTKLRSLTRRMIAKHQINLVIIDYLQQMSIDPGGKKSWSRDTEVGNLSRSCKQLAMDSDVHVMILAQLNRAADGAQPMLKHLRESGNLEQDADLVLFIHRHHFDEDRGDPRAILHVAKQRNGGVCRVKVDFDYSKGKMMDAGKLGRDEKY